MSYAPRPHLRRRPPVRRIDPPFTHHSYSIQVVPFHRFPLGTILQPHQMASFIENQNRKALNFLATVKYARHLRYVCDKFPEWPMHIHSVVVHQVNVTHELTMPVYSIRCNHHIKDANFLALPITSPDASLQHNANVDSSGKSDSDRDRTIVYSGYRAITGYNERSSSYGSGSTLSDLTPSSSETGSYDSEKNKCKEEEKFDDTITYEGTSIRRVVPTCSDSIPTSSDSIPTSSDSISRISDSIPTSSDSIPTSSDSILTSSDSDSSDSENNDDKEAEKTIINRSVEETFDQISVSIEKLINSDTEGSDTDRNDDKDSFQDEKLLQEELEPAGAIISRYQDPCGTEETQTFCTGFELAFFGDELEHVMTTNEIQKIFVPSEPKEPISEIPESKKEITESRKEITDSKKEITESKTENTESDSENAASSSTNERFDSESERPSSSGSEIVLDTSSDNEIGKPSSSTIAKTSTNLDDSFSSSEQLYNNSFELSDAYSTSSISSDTSEESLLKERALRYQPSSTTTEYNSTAVLMELNQRLEDFRPPARWVTESLKMQLIEKLVSYEVNDERYLKNKVHCYVCLSNYQFQDKIRVLPCLHEFHTKCVDVWLQRNMNCPVCREEI